MITREEYLNALEIVDKYNRQLNSYDTEIVNSRETVDDFIKKNRRKFSSNKVPNLLKSVEFASNPKSRIFIYMDEVNERDFKRVRHAGKVSWLELNFIMNESNR